MVDLIRGVRTRVVPSGAWNYDSPMWSAAGDRVLYVSQEKGHTDLYTRLADGSGQVEPFLVDDSDKTLYDWSRDGKRVVYWRVGSGTGKPDLWLYSTETQRSEVLIAGDPTYLDARFSQDGDYVAYASDESGRLEVFVQAIDGGARWLVSTAGGALPHWRDDGREIVYFDPNARLMAVSFETETGGVRLGTPRELFTIEETIVDCDASGDHQRFLCTQRDETASEPLRVILGWDR